MVQPFISLSLDGRIIRRNLEIRTDDQIPYQRHIQFTGSRFTQRITTRRKAELNQRYIRSRRLRRDLCARAFGDPVRKIRV